MCLQHKQKFLDAAKGEERVLGVGWWQLEGVEFGRWQLLEIVEMP